MSFDLTALDWLGRQTAAYLNEICFALIATLLAIYGQDINRALRARTRHLHFALRTLTFIMLCAFGYGWLTLMVAPRLAWLVRQLPLRSIPFVVLITFVLLGMIAERKRKI